jgi:hypothetical protein
VDIKLLKITLNFDVLTLVVTSDMKNITHTIKRSWLFWFYESPSVSNGDLLPSDGKEEDRDDLLLMQIMMRIHDIVEMIPIKVK